MIADLRERSEALVGEVDVRPLIQERLPLERGVEALDLAKQRLKVLLEINPS